MTHGSPRDGRLDADRAKGCPQPLDLRALPRPVDPRQADDKRPAGDAEAVNHRAKPASTIGAAGSLLDGRAQRFHPAGYSAFEPIAQHLQTNRAVPLRGDGGGVFPGMWAGRHVPVDLTALFVRKRPAASPEPAGEQYQPM
jgi:hypothetical protein